jgi:hypothetical protein
MAEAVRCAHHPGRAALGYCSRCGKPLCTECLVRLSAGNFCSACADAPARPVRARGRIPWWAIVLAALAVLVLLRALLH